VARPLLSSETFRPILNMKDQWLLLLAGAALFMARPGTAAEVSIAVPDSKVSATTTATIKMQADGTENTVQFTLCWNPAVLQYVSHALGTSASGATAFPNVDQVNGRLGIMIGLAPNQVFPSGLANLLAVNFTAAALTATTLEFRDDVSGFPKKKVISAAADTITSTFLNLSLAGSSQSGLPVISQQPVAILVALGGSATFSVTATASPAPAFQWRKNTVPIFGATNPVFTVASVASADAGTYDVVITSSGGAVTSSSATLTISSTTGVPVISVQPVAQIDSAPGSTVTISVETSGSPAPTYQWYRNGTPVAGATNASLSLSNIQASAAGLYTAVITNGAGSVTSSPSAISVTRSGNSASHAVVASGYSPGQTVTITNTLVYSGAATALSWWVRIPAGWSYASSSGSQGDQRPSVGSTEILEWAWSTIPTSPVTFSYNLNVPPGESGSKQLTSLAGVRNGESLQFLARPDNLPVPQLTSHSADTDQNFRIALLELTRVIELYNTRFGTTRSGSYSVASTPSEDGFLPDSTRDSSSLVSLTRYHSADSDRNGRISLLELTRVIELYNYRSGTARTGQYKVQAGTEDGFAPGP